MERQFEYSLSPRLHAQKNIFLGQELRNTVHSPQSYLAQTAKLETFTPKHEDTRTQLQAKCPTMVSAWVHMRLQNYKTNADCPFHSTELEKPAKWFNIENRSTPHCETWQYIKERILKYLPK